VVQLVQVHVAPELARQVPDRQPALVGLTEEALFSGNGIPVRLRTGGARLEGAKPVVDHSTIPVETEPGPLIQIASPRS